MEIIFNTAQGEFVITDLDSSKTLNQICLINNVPFSSVSFYAKKRNGELRQVVGAFSPIGSLVSKEEILIIQPNRNVNYEMILKKSVLVDKKNNPSTEYTFAPNEISNELHHFEFTPNDCKEYVLNEVVDFLNITNFNDRPIVFGISGGGDSNTLLQAFVNSKKIRREQIIAVMCLGLPTWDSAKSRAIELCEEFNVQLNFVYPEDICKLLGKQPNKDWFSGFEEVFNDTEMAEILGTLVVRLALQQKVKEFSAQSMIIGLNLEDILAECFMYNLKGQLPMPFPIREIDNIPIWYPLYRVPKKILDGCYPKLSLENYQQRVNDKLQGRAVIYHIAQTLNTILPSVEFDLLRGFQKLSQLNKNYCFFDEELGFSVAEPLPKILKDKWKYFTVY